MSADVTPDESPDEGPGVTPGESSGESSTSGPGESPGVTPGESPGVGPGESSTSGPGVSSGESSTSGPGESSDATPGGGPGVTPGASPGAAPGVTPGESSTSGRGVTPGVTSGDAGYTLRPHSKSSAWGVVPGLAKVCFRRWYLVIPIVVIVGSICAYVAFANMDRSLLPVSVATANDSDSVREASIAKKYATSIEPGLFLFTSEQLTFEDAKGKLNPEFVSAVDAAVAVIDSKAGAFVGAPSSVLTNKAYANLASKDKRSIVAIANLYGSSASAGEMSLAASGIPKIVEGVAEAQRRTGLDIAFVSATRLTDAVAEGVAGSLSNRLVVAVGPALIVILVLSVGTLVGTGLLVVFPFGTPITTLLVALAGVVLLGQVTPINTLGVMALALIALTVGIDCTIRFSRAYSHEYYCGAERQDAVAYAAQIAGRPAAAGALVASCGIAPLLFLNSTVLRSFAFSAIVALVVVAVEVIFVVPALVGMGGRLLAQSRFRWHDPATDPLVWRIRRLLVGGVRFPRTALAVSLVVLGALSIVSLWMRPYVGTTTLVPKGSEAAADLAALNERISPGVVGASTIAVLTARPVFVDVDTFEREKAFANRIANDHDTFFVAGPEQVVDQIEELLPDDLPFSTEVLPVAGKALEDVADRNFGALIPLLAGQDPDELLGKGQTKQQQATQRDQIALDAVPLALAGVPGLGGAVESLAVDETIFVQAMPNVTPDSADAERWIERIRGYALDVYGESSDTTFNLLGRAFVGGSLAAGVDVGIMERADLGWVLLAIGGALFLASVIALRAPLAALMLAAVELLVATAAFGLVTGIVQFGWLNFLVHNKVGYVEAEVPVLVLCVLLAVSLTTYVPMLKRQIQLHEAAVLGWQPYMHGDRMRGLIGSARVGIAGSLILLAVFVPLSASTTALMAQIGVGLAAAVGLDFFVVRRSIVPPALYLFRRQLLWRVTDRWRRGAGPAGKHAEEATR